MIVSDSKPDLTLVYRAPVQGGHSIERLFGAIHPYLENDFRITRLEVPCSGTKLSEMRRNIEYVRKQSRGIVHVTGDVNYVAGFLGNRPTLLTVHDCGNWMKLKGLKRQIFRWLWYTLPCRKSRITTTVSEATKDVLTKMVGIPAERVQVIDNCIPSSPPPTKRIFSSDRPRILQIGSGAHKNLSGLIQAVRGRSCELIIVGNPSSVDRESLIEHRIPHTIETKVSDERIQAIYGEVDILFFASFHEGFGLPILEAQAAGVPVITSDVYSMPYVAGDAAWVVSPSDADAIRRSIESICLDSQLRCRRVLSGKENVSRFHPASIARQYADVYKRLVPNV